MAAQCHWLVQAAVDAGIVGYDALTLSAMAPTAQAWEEVINRSRLPSMEVCRAIARMLGLPVARLASVDPRTVECVPERLRDRLQIVPLRQDGVKLFVATSDPYDVESAKEIEFATGLCVVFALAPPGALRRLLQGPSPSRTTDVTFKLLPSPPRLAGLCIREAIRRESTRIEMSVDAAGGTVRISGHVKDAILRLPVPLWRAVLQTLKTIAGLDANEAPCPQIGRVRHEVDGRPWDLTVTTTPSDRGETATILISQPATHSTLEALGFAPDVVNRIRGLLAGSGVVIVCGPRGAGNEAAIRAIADELLRAGKDVVELAGGRPARRTRDADGVAVVGRVDDASLAGAAVAAALGGHLVVISMKVDDASSAMDVLNGYGVETSTAACVVRGSVFVNCVRRFCSSCAAPIGRMSESESRLAREHGITPLFRPVGCVECGLTGFSGTIPLARVSSFGEPIAAADERPLGLELVVTGQTSIEEAARLWLPQRHHDGALTLVKC